jgi:hypothetical protein
MPTKPLRQELATIRAHLNSGAFADGLAALRRVMSRAPFSRHAQLLLGEYFWRQGQFDRAGTAMRWAVVTSPTGHEGWRGLALLALNDAGLGRAADFYRRARITGAEAWGLVETLSKRPGGKEIKAILCLDPRDPEATAHVALASIGGPDQGFAHRRLTRARILSSKLASADVMARLFSAHGRALQARDQSSTARGDLRRAVLLDPGNPELGFDFGRAEFEVGNIAAAARLVIHTLTARPSDAGFERRHVRSLIARHPTEARTRPGYHCQELAEAFSVSIEAVGQPGPRIDYRVPATFLARADDALLLAGHHSVILPDDTVLIEGLTYRQKRRRWDGPCYPYVSSDNQILGVLPTPGDRIEGEAILLGGGVNYYHCVVDWLSRLPTILGNGELDNLPVLVDSSTPSSVIDLLAMFGLKRERLRFVTPGLYPVDRLWIPSLAHGRLGCVSPRYLEFIERNVFNEFRDPQSRGRKRLYFARRDDRHRRIVNAEELNAVLERHGFETVFLEHLPVVEQFALAADAEIMVAPFGAGLTNILAAPTTTTVIELTHHQAVRPLFPILAGARGQPFYRITGRSVGAAGMLPMHADFEIPTNALETVLRELSSLD